MLLFRDIKAERLDSWLVCKLHEVFKKLLGNASHSKFKKLERNGYCCSVSQMEHEDINT